MSPLVSRNDLIEIDVIKLLSTNDKFKKKVDFLVSSFVKMNDGIFSNSKSNTPNLSPMSNKDILGKDKNFQFNNNNNNIQNNLLLKNSSNSVNSQLNNLNNGKLGNLNYNQYGGINNSYLNKNFKNNFKTDLVVKEGEISTLNNNDGSIIVKKIVLDEKGKYKISPDNFNEPLYDKFLKKLLNPIEWIKKPHLENSKFEFSKQDIIKLTNMAIEVIKEQPMLLKVSTPCKVFGDIHGQYSDLMTFFYKWGEPKEGPNGDILNVDYLFLGDYVDRGTMSLETMCLLMALKVKYPNSIHLLRGNHEDRLINQNFGFADECQIRLGENTDQEDSVFNLINLFFEYLPLAAIIEDQIFCLHGGIGNCVRKLSDISQIERPLEVVHEASNDEQQKVMDVLWSDPTDYDTELGIQPNIQRDSNNYGNIVKFGPDIVKKFLQDNGLSFIIRAHECVQDGFERFAGGMLITVFSATDYCRRHGNAGAMLMIKNNFEIYPYLIYPPEGGNQNWIDNDEFLSRRPPTPPRISYNNSNY